MEEFEAKIHRTFVDYLIRTKQTDLAAVMVDGGVDWQMGQNDFGEPYVTFYIDVPTKAMELIESNKQAKADLQKALQAVLTGQFLNGYGNLPHDATIKIRMKLLPVEEGWQSVARSLIANHKGANQALVSDIASDGRPLHKWNELRYASASEVRIAQEFEKRKILFFPLTVGVRAETGKNWQDHREIDFLVCDDGCWGILEVAYHPDRFEKDAEKDLWFKKSGILCIQHFTAERCYNTPSVVVDEFLSVLRQHKR